MSTPQERAARRRQTWGGEIVHCGGPKGSLYRQLRPAERLLALTRLNERVWASAGVARVAAPRSSWPGEIFELRRHG